MKNLLRFRVGNIIGLSLRKVPHLPMCGNLTLSMVLNISKQISYGKLVALLSFQQNWFHLFWISFMKVIGFAVFVMLVVG